MKPLKSKQSGNTCLSRPFEHLQDLLDREKLPDSPRPVQIHSRKRPLKTDPECERRLFEDAMADVTPIPKENRAYHPGKCILPAQAGPEVDPEAEIVARLEKLVQYGHGFVVSDTPEYMEGRGDHISPDVTRRLHRGDISIQAHIDLHGLKVYEAREVFEEFLEESIASGRQAVAVIHGRGLSSPVKPVLKTKVCRWLTRGPWRKYVVAFASARSCDGGAGATYVLLRRRPITKRYRRRRTPRHTPEIIP